jgi:putative transposase
MSREIHVRFCESPGVQFPRATRLREGKRVKFAFIHAEKALFSVAALCRTLGVSRQGYYAYASRPTSERIGKDAALHEKVRESFLRSKERYGSPRVLRELRVEGHEASKRRVERAMRAMGLSARKPRCWRRNTTQVDPSNPVADNVLNRDFTATRPNERWVTDITYVWTDEGWCYLAAILDLFSRSVVGWALMTTLSTELPMKALKMAIQRRRPDAGLLHHSDRGCQYTSYEYRTALARHGITASMSRTGNCWDNAVAESFFATLKNELVHRRSWATRLELREAVFEYIEVFYNRRRLHSSIGYKTPSEVEDLYAANAA